MLKYYGPYSAIQLIPFNLIYMAIYTVNDVVNILFFEKIRTLRKLLVVFVFHNDQRIKDYFKQITKERFV